MRRTPKRVAEEGRVSDGPMGSDRSYGCTGQFRISGLLIQASDGAGWDHVSVSLPRRAPTWEEMAYVKSLFWEPEEMVIQYHPARSDYVNFHPHCLHMWKPQGVEMPKPPAILVGPS